MIKPVPVPQPLVSAFKVFHHLDELSEQVICIVWSRRSLGVILNREGWSGLVAQAFNRIVVEVDVGDQRILLQGTSIDCKAVIL